MNTKNILKTFSKRIENAFATFEADLNYSFSGEFKDESSLDERKNIFDISEEERSKIITNVIERANLILKNLEIETKDKDYLNRKEIEFEFSKEILSAQELFDCFLSYLIVENINKVTKKIFENFCKKFSINKNIIVVCTTDTNNIYNWVDISLYSYITDLITDRLGSEYDIVAFKFIRIYDENNKRVISNVYTSIFRSNEFIELLELINI